MASTRIRKVCPRCPTCGRKITTVRLALDRFLEQVEVQPNGCWLWTGSITSDGYGQFGDDFKVYAAHRWAYETYIGPIPEGLVLDHTCHKSDECPGGKCIHRRCVNPEHLEPVTTQENTRRGCIGQRGKITGQRQREKTHCPKGHEYTPENTYTWKGHRNCKTCMAAAARKYEHKRPKRNGPIKRH